MALLSYEFALKSRFLLRSIPLKYQQHIFLEMSICVDLQRIHAPVVFWNTSSSVVCANFRMSELCTKCDVNCLQKLLVRSTRFDMQTRQLNYSLFK